MSDKKEFDKPPAQPNFDEFFESKMKKHKITREEAYLCLCGSMPKNNHSANNMINYSLSLFYSVGVYKKACKYIEKIFGDNLTKENEVIYDGRSQAQSYKTPKGKVTVYNEFYCDEVTAISEFEIKHPDWIRSNVWF